MRNIKFTVVVVTLERSKGWNGIQEEHIGASKLLVMLNILSQTVKRAIVDFIVLYTLRVL